VVSIVHIFIAVDKLPLMVFLHKLFDIKLTTFAYIAHHCT